MGELWPQLASWLALVSEGVAEAGRRRDPVRNAWVIMGSVRGIPLFWRLIDCGFGVIGCVPLVICRRLMRRLETANRS